ncbi:MAG: hypothetical protein KGS45_00235 [Planctomycetes bacterium]|nr:hypothetical protein [Planctomycetota bacterium]
MPLTLDPQRVADAAPPVSPASPTHCITIIRGCPSDLSTLSQHHYRITPPVAVERILSAIDTHTGDVVGVLAASRPPLNDSWRAIAWPHLLPTHLAPRERAKVINANIRIISRVIVCPARRSLSIAKDLVSCYLADPLTPCTEALAAMGDLVPFFQRAGMRAIPLSTPRRDLTLLRALASSGITPLDLAGLDHLVHLSHPIPDALAVPLRRWASAHRSTRSLTDLDTIALKASNALLSPRCAYVSP